MLANLATVLSGGASLTEFTATNQITSTCKFVVPELVGKSGFVLCNDTATYGNAIAEYFCIWFSETQKVAGSARYNYTPTFDPATGTVTIGASSSYMQTVKGWCW